VQIAAKISLLLLAPVLGACGSLPDMDSFRAPDSSTFFRPLSVANIKDKTLPPVTAEDIVDASGRCAGAVATAPPVNDVQSSGPTNVSLQDVGVPMMSGAIALDMTECDVVKRAGLAEKVEIGTNERNERSATLTYILGPRAGIYRFSEGRLRSMERAPEPPAPSKPAKPAKGAPKSKQTANR
jgi:hypothetical protein